MSISPFREDYMPHYKCGVTIEMLRGTLLASSSKNFPGNYMYTLEIHELHGLIVSGVGNSEILSWLLGFSS